MTTIDKLQAATGPDRELDAEIAFTLGWRMSHGRWWTAEQASAARKAKRAISAVGVASRLPYFTADTDEARTIKPGVSVILNIAEDDITTAIGDGPEGCGDTPALALCIASLKAIDQGEQI